MRIRLCLVVLVSVIGGTAAAQGKPDFLGRWVLVNPDAFDADVARELVVRESFEAPVTVMRVERRSKGEVRTDRYEVGLAGGTVSGIAEDRRGPTTHTRFLVVWRGDTLVIETGNYSGPMTEPGPYSEHGETWSLDAQGRLVMTVTDRASGTKPRTIQLTYRRP